MNPCYHSSPLIRNQYSYPNAGTHPINTVCDVISRSNVRREGATIRPGSVWLISYYHSTNDPLEWYVLIYRIHWHCQRKLIAVYNMPIVVAHVFEQIHQWSWIYGLLLDRFSATSSWLLSENLIGLEICSSVSVALFESINTPRDGTLRSNILAFTPPVWEQCSLI